MHSKNKDHSYPSDITREQFKIIRPILESARKKTKPRVVDLYDVFCGVLYILKSDASGGCFQQTSLNGEHVMNILEYGVRRKMVKIVSLIRF